MLDKPSNAVPTALTIAGSDSGGGAGLSVSYKGPDTTPTAADNLCDEYSWPDKDHGLVCGPCKVLVDRFDSTYG